MTSIPGRDPETDPGWLARLRSLNESVAATGEPLIGNVCYYNNQPDFSERSPIPGLRAKRDRIRSAIVGRRRLLEIGVNGGHSAYVALSASPDLEYHGVDICPYSYVERAIGWLQREFPNRVFFHPGDSRRVLPVLATSGHLFDAFHIDGGYDRCYVDIANASRMAHDGAVLLVDDALELGVRLAVSSLMLFGTLARHEAFPSIERFQPTKRVLLLRRSSLVKYRALCAYGAVLDGMHDLRMTRLGRAAIPRARENPLD